MKNYKRDVFTSISPPQKQNYFIEWIAELLGIHRDQLRGGLNPRKQGFTVLISGCYRKQGIYYEFAIDINTGDVVKNEVC